MEHLLSIVAKDLSTDETPWSPSPFKGFSYKFFKISGEHTLNLVKIEAGAEPVPHRHSIRQLSYLVQGRWQALNGQEYGAGSFLDIPAGVRHGGTALEECVFVDVFLGYLNWFLDDGRVLGVNLQGEYQNLGKVEALEQRNII